MFISNEVKKNRRNRKVACTVLFIFTFTALKLSYDLALTESQVTISSTIEESIETTTEIELDTTTTEAVTETTTKNNNSNYIGRFWCTSYCSCSECCGHYAYNRPTDENGNEIVVGASGMELIPGYSVAVDPSIIPYGTIIVIDGQEYVAADTGISGYRLDFYCSSHEEALNNGNRWAEVYRK